MEVYVINLNKRQDRWIKIKSKFNNLNLIRIEAIEHINGVIGCFKSHQKCVKLAKDKNLKKILVLEDDCDLLNIDLNNFEILINKLDMILDRIIDWTMFYGAGNKLRIENLQKKIHEIDHDNNKTYKIYETNFLKTAHFVWYNNVVYDWILKQQTDEIIPIDKIWHNQFNCLVMIPFICTQQDDYSDIEKKECSYTKSLIKYEKKLLKYLEIK